MEDKPENFVLEELGSQAKSVVMAAIVKAVDFASEQSIVDKLRELSQNSDKEISLYSKNALVRMNVKGTKEDSTSQSYPFSRKQILRSKRDEIPMILEKFRQDPNGVPEDLRFFMAEFVGRHGNSSDGKTISLWLSKALGNFAVPYLEALSKIEPQKFVEVLHIYLASPHPFVRAKSIALLQKIDPEEAFAHLNELLASEKTEEKLAGLEIAFHFPFEEIASLLFTLLTEPVDPVVVRGVAVLLLSNPGIETAFRLLELREVVAAAQADTINKVFHSLLKTLVVVEMLTPAEAAPEALQEKFKSERLEKYLSELEVQVSLGDPQSMESIESWLKKNRDDSRVKRFIMWLGKNPATEEMHHRLLEEKTSDSKEKPAAIGEFDFNSATSEQKCEYLISVGDPVSPGIEKWICEEAKTGEDSVRATALKVLGRLAIKSECVAIAESNLNHSNPLVIIRAFNLLAKIDKTKIVGRIEKILDASDPLIVSKVFLVAVKHCKEKAVATAIRLLESDQPQVRAHAIKCLMVCPFGKVSKNIFAALPKESHPNIAKGLLFILMNNPCPEALKALDSLPNAKNPAVGMLIAQTRGNLFKTLLSLDLVGEADCVPQKPTPPEAPPPKKEAEGKPERFVLPPKVASTPAATKTQDESKPVKYSEPKTEAKTEPKTEAKTEPKSEPKSEERTEPKTEEKPVKPVEPAETKQETPLPKAYSTFQVRNTIRKREIAQKQAEKATKSFLLHPAFLTVGVLAVVLFVFSNIYQQTNRYKFAGGKIDETQPYIMVKGFQMNVPCKMTGKVESVEPDKTVKFLAEGKKFRLEFPGTMPRIFPTEEAAVEIVPYRNLSSGEIMAQCYSYKPK